MSEFIFMVPKNGIAIKSRDIWARMPLSVTATAASMRVPLFGKLIELRMPKK